MWQGLSQWEDKECFSQCNLRAALCPRHMLVTLLPLHISWGVYPLALIAYPTNDSWRRNKNANFYLQTNITTVIVQVPEESGVCYHGSSPHPHSLLQCVFCSCFADLTFHCPFIYLCVCEKGRGGDYMVLQAAVKYDLWHHSVLDATAPSLEKGGDRDGGWC